MEQVRLMQIYSQGWNRLGQLGDKQNTQLGSTLFDAVKD